MAVIKIILVSLSLLLHDTQVAVIKNLVTSKPMTSQAWTCLQLQMLTEVDIGSERVKRLVSNGRPDQTAILV